MILLCHEPAGLTHEPPNLVTLCPFRGSILEGKVAIGLEFQGNYFLCFHPAVALVITKKCQQPMALPSVPVSEVLAILLFLCLLVLCHLVAFLPFLDL